MERCGQFSVRLYSYEATSQRTCMSFHQCLDIYKLGEISSCDNPAGAGIVFVFGNTRERFDLAQLWFLLVNPTPFLYVAEKRLQLHPTPGESTPNLMSNSALVRIWRFIFWLSLLPQSQACMVQNRVSKKSRTTSGFWAKENKIQLAELEVHFLTYRLTDKDVMRFKNSSNAQH